MLKELLVEISASNYISKTQLAAKLQRPVGLIADGIVQLVRLGYLAEGQGLEDCDAHCAKCPYASLCIGNAIHTLSITAAGERFLQGQ
ncbi:MAG: hypothetical protein ACOX46_00790 [Limnochordia bacterium]|jgi:hypothetical protein|nr:hypothetical protein [Bacillota bacterium]HBG09588.1 hypothetical protein [Bacillota bacterium]